MSKTRSHRLDPVKSWALERQKDIAIETTTLTLPSGQAEASLSTKQCSPWTGGLMTRTGFTFSVRPAVPGDEGALAEFFTHVTPEDLRFRFLTSLRKVDHERLKLLTHSDHAFRCRPVLRQKIE